MPDGHESRHATVSRRNFLLRAGRFGGGMLVAIPGLRGGLIAEPPGAVPSSDALEHGILPRTIGPVPESLFSGLRWRLLGPSAAAAWMR